MGGPPWGGVRPQPSGNNGLQTHPQIFSAVQAKRNITAIAPPYSKTKHFGAPRGGWAPHTKRFNCWECLHLVENIFGRAAKPPTKFQSNCSKTIKISKNWGVPPWEGGSDPHLVEIVFWWIANPPTKFQLNPSKTNYYSDRPPWSRGGGAPPGSGGHPIHHN